MRVEVAEKQLAEWQRRGEWTERDTAICRLLSQWPLGTTSQIAWVLFHSASGLVLARRAMRRLQQMGVVERQRLVLRVGRPEDVYRMIPEWSIALGLPVQEPLEGDLARHWILADTLAVAAWNKDYQVRVAPPGHSQADWVVEKPMVDWPAEEEPFGHRHEFIYLIDIEEDFARFYGAVRAFEQRLVFDDKVGYVKVWPECQHADEENSCMTTFIGYDVTLSAEWNGTGPFRMSPWEERLRAVEQETWGDDSGDPRVNYRLWRPEIFPYHPVRIPMSWSAWRDDDGLGVQG